MFSTSTLARSVLPAATLTLAALLAGCAGGGQSAAKAQPEEAPIMHQVAAADLEYVKSTRPVADDTAILWVNGLGCPLCASALDKQLERVKGVSSTKVDMAAGTATVGFRGEPHPSPSRLADAVADAGFTLVKIDRP